MDVSEYTKTKPWNKGMKKETDFKISEMAKKQSNTRVEKLKKGKIKIWNKGLTKSKDKRLLISADKQSKTKINKTGGNKRYHHNQARKIMNVKDSNICVHHIDNNPFNNSKDNLKLVTRSEHVKIHLPRKGKKLNYRR